LAKSPRILIGTVVFFLIIAAGFAAGFYVSYKLPQKANSLTAYAPTGENTPHINNRPYEISPPSIGSDLITFDVPSLVFENAIYSQQVDTSRLTGIEKGQKVLLYDKDGKLLDSMGEVTSFGEELRDTPEKKTLVITYTQPGITGEYMVASGKIVMGREQSLYRLPRSAIVQNEKGEPHVWEASADELGHYKAYLKGVQLVRVGDDYAAITPMPDSSNTYILKPDQYLKDGQPLNARPILYTGPELTADYIVQDKLDDITYQRMAVMRENQRHARAMAQAATCGPVGTTQQFINKVKGVPPVPVPASPQEPPRGVMSKPLS
jgi:hypothetical protein